MKKRTKKYIVFTGIFLGLILIINLFSRYYIESSAFRPIGSNLYYSVNNYYINHSIRMILPAYGPPLGSAREASRRISCSSNLKQIGLSLYQYSMDYDGYFPDKGFSQLYNGDYLTDLKIYTCPSTTTIRLSQDELKRGINVDYVYIGHGLNVKPKDVRSYLSRIPIAYDNPNNHNFSGFCDRYTDGSKSGYINVLFADGKVHGYHAHSWEELVDSKDWIIKMKKGDVHE